MKEAELKKLLKPVKENHLKYELSPNGFALLKEAIETNARLTKQVKALETRINNIQARLINLELSEKCSKMSLDKTEE